MYDLLYAYSGKEYKAELAVIKEVQLLPTRYRVMVEGLRGQWNMTLVTLDLTEGHKEYRRIEEGLLDMTCAYSGRDLEGEMLILIVNDRGRTFAVANPSYPERVFVLDEDQR